jgi:hypothetical protein
MQELREFSEMTMEQNKNKDALDRLLKQHGPEKVVINAVRRTTTRSRAG